MLPELLLWTPHGYYPAASISGVDLVAHIADNPLDAVPDDVRVVQEDVPCSQSQQAESLLLTGLPRTVAGERSAEEDPAPADVRVVRADLCTDTFDQEPAAVLRQGVLRTMADVATGVCSVSRDGKVKDGRGEESEQNAPKPVCASESCANIWPPRRIHSVIRKLAARRGC